MDLPGWQNTEKQIFQISYEVAEHQLEYKIKRSAWR
jgi:hypothetical protein